MRQLIIIPTLNSPKTYPKVPFQYVRTPNLAKTQPRFVLTVTLVPKFSHQLSNNIY